MFKVKSQNVFCSLFILKFHVCFKKCTRVILYGGKNSTATSPPIHEENLRKVKSNWPSENPNDTYTEDPKSVCEDTCKWSKCVSGSIETEKPGS